MNLVSVHALHDQLQKRYPGGRGGGNYGRDTCTTHGIGVSQLSDGADAAGSLNFSLYRYTACFDTECGQHGDAILASALMSESLSTCCSYFLVVLRLECRTDDAALSMAIDALDLPRSIGSSMWAILGW